MRAVKQNITSVWIVQPTLKLNSKSKDASDLVVEAVALAKALPGTKIYGSIIVKIEKFSPKAFFGKGKVGELSSIFKLKLPCNFQLNIAIEYCQAISNSNFHMNIAIEY